MDELILRVLAGEATRFEVERLRQWRAESPENEARVGDLARVWSLTGPDAFLEPCPSTIDEMAESILSAAESRRRADVESPFPSPVGRRVLPLRSLAPWGAALAASVAALAFGLRFSAPDANVPSPVAPEVSIAMTAQTLRLDDGSFVRLAPGSRLEARLGKDQRTVELEGRAFFAVAPDGGRPFEVQTEKGKVRVLGTRFEVATRDNGLRTVVVEGRVELATADGLVDVPGGHVGHAVEGERPQTTPVEDVLTFLDWPGGLLVFHDTPLHGVAREVERHFGIPVRIEARGADSLRISASFEEDESFHEVVETLCSVTGSECRIDGDGAAIGPRIGEGR